MDHPGRDRTRGDGRRLQATCHEGQYALKAIKPELASDPEVHERFVQEAMNATQLRHDNIVESQAPFNEGGRLFIPMEFLEGQELGECMDAGLGFSPEQVTRALTSSSAWSEPCSWLEAHSPRPQARKPLYGHIWAR